jgi:ornithine cyclodeaminase/alanine dehydrogenase
VSTLLYLARRDVELLLPPLEEQLALVEETYRAMAAGRVELPPKPAIHPRPNAFLHAMPAYVGGSVDVAAVKWVAAYRGNKERGLGYISGLIVVNDADTGLPLAVMDATEITAARTAAASGVCVRSWAPPGWRSVAIIGWGVQGRRHADVLRALNPGAAIRVFDPKPARVQAAGMTAAVKTVREAVEGAEVVVTAAPMTDEADPPIRSDWLRSSCLVLPVDFDASVEPGVAAEADLFLVDSEPQYEHFRGAGSFRGWPRAHGTVGAALGANGKPSRVVCANLGVGALDAAFAKAALDEARRRSIGTTLPL